jgi:hypothetical protein
MDRFLGGFLLSGSSNGGKDDARSLCLRTLFLYTCADARCSTTQNKKATAYCSCAQNKLIAAASYILDIPQTEDTEQAMMLQVFDFRKQRGLL